MTAQRRAIAALGVGALIASCIASVPSTRTQRATSHRVTIAGFRYLPDTLRVTPGDTVVFRNSDQFGHTASSRTAGVLETSLIAGGDSARWIATTEGTVDYICAFHPSMRGVIEVGEWDEW